jgi:hypothetical protein
MTLDVKLEADVRIQIWEHVLTPAFPFLQPWIIEIANNKAIRRLEGLVKSKNPVVRHSVQLYVHSLPADVPLPPGLHVSRDTTQLECDSRTGHHSINSTHGDENGLLHVEKLKNVPFSKPWIVKLQYTFIPVGDQGTWLCERDDTIAAEGHELENKFHRWVKALVV